MMAPPSEWQWDEALPARVPAGLDPKTLTVVFAAWCLVSAMSFLKSDDLFGSHLYEGLARTGLSASQFGWMLVIDGLALCACLGRRTSMPIRMVLCFGSSCLWLWIGSHVVRSGLQYAVYPRSGTWDLVCGIGLGIAMMQWPFYGVRHAA